MNLCGLIENPSLRERLSLLAADAGWSCWLSDDAALFERVLDTMQPAAELVITDAPAHLGLLARCAGRAPVILLARDGGEQHASATVLDALLPDAELLLSFKTCVNARRFRERFADLDSHEPITSLPRHDELLRSLGSHQDAGMGLLVVQIDHPHHLYSHLDPVSRSDLLGALGEQVRRALPPQAVLGFYDPACFAAALPGFSAATTAGAAQTLVTAMRQPLAFRGGQMHITVSVGYGFEALFSDADRLWTQAWRAMRQALEEGGDRAAGMAETAAADRLPNALTREEFSLVLQPQFGADGERLTGAEVLLRWQGLEVGNLSPSQFIPLAERRGHMARIGDWVLERACREAATWFENRINPLRLGVNVSPHQFGKGAIVDQINRFRAERWLDPAILELELPHEAMLALVDTHREHLYRLRDLGVRFALDNLGSGLMDTNRLLRCPVDTLKIDRSLIQRIEADPRARELAEQICRLGQRFGLRVVAVGVETQAQLIILQGFGCTDVQGFLFSQPVSLARFGELLTNRPT
jgi:EAL domain-containing protein (putative c-di-GMP-specific phosphodiesterase class I)/GGDEF domain-containing protein